MTLTLTLAQAQAQAQAVRSAAQRDAECGQAGRQACGRTGQGVWQEMGWLMGELGFTKGRRVVEQR